MPWSFFQRSRRITMRNLQRDLTHLFVNGAVGGENHRPAQTVRLTCKIADFAAGLLNQERAGRGIPRLQAEFPEAIEATGGYASKMERGGAIAAHAVRALRKIPIIVNVGICQTFVHWEARTQ